MRILSTVLIAVGVLLILLSPMWNRIASSSVFWDETAVEEYSSTVVQRHHAMAEASINPSAAKSAKQAQEEFQQSQAKFNRARQFRQRGGPMMRMLGGILAVIGIGIYFATRPTSD